MITATRLDGSRFAVNPDLIERVQASPDTTLHTVGGQVFVIKETLEEAVALIVAYRAQVLVAAHALISTQEV